MRAAYSGGLTFQDIHFAAGGRKMWRGRRWEGEGVEW